MFSSIDFSLCFWDGSLIPLTFSWKVAGMDVFNVKLSASGVVASEVGTGVGSWRLDEELLEHFLTVVLFGRLLRCLSGFLQDLVESGAGGLSLLAASSCNEAGCLGLLG